MKTRFAGWRRAGAALVALVALFASVMVVVGPAGTAAAQATGGGTFAWGDNAFGQLGDGTTAAHFTLDPTLAPALEDIAGGRHHIVGLEDDGDITLWGWNRYGQMGDGTKANRPTPVTITSIDAVGVAAGHYHSLAVDSLGQVWGWGRNRFAQLGDGTITDRLSPIQVPGATNASEVDAGREHSAALLNDGTLLVWGNNDEGQLGLGDFTQRLTPTAVPGLSGVESLAFGRVHSLALMDDGTVMAWGDNKHGQVGDGTTIDRSSPTVVPGLTNIVELAAFGFHSMALDSSGQVWVWGLGGTGQIGNGTTKNTNTSPILISSLSNIATIGAGRNHSLAADTSGVVWAWGKNDLGQLGDGTTVNRTTPVAVGTIADTVRLVAGRDYSSALSSTIDPPAGDSTPPEGTIVTPANNGTVASPVLLSGTATDNVGVGDVSIAIKRLSDGQWLRNDGSFGSYQKRSATLASPGAAATDWDLTMAIPDGVYRMYSPTTDTSGNKDPVADNHKFTVSATGPDTEAPDGSITDPANGATVGSPVAMNGLATDNVGVGEVFVAVKRLSDGQWLRLDGSFGGYQRHPANLTSPGATATAWDISLTMPPADYRMYVPVFDTSDNKDPATAQRVFTVN